MVMYSATATVAGSGDDYAGLDADVIVALDPFVVAPGAGILDVLAVAGPIGGGAEFGLMTETVYVFVSAGGDTSTACFNNTGTNAAPLGFVQTGVTNNAGEAEFNVDAGTYCVLHPGNSFYAPNATGNVNESIAVQAVVDVDDVDTDVDARIEFCFAQGQPPYSNCIVNP